MSVSGLRVEAHSVRSGSTTIAVNSGNLLVTHPRNRTSTPRDHFYKGYPEN